jgi:hypothetical protein
VDSISREYGVQQYSGCLSSRFCMWKWRVSAKELTGNILIRVMFLDEISQ